MLLTGLFRCHAAFAWLYWTPEPEKKPDELTQEQLDQAAGGAATAPKPNWIEPDIDPTTGRPKPPIIPTK